MTDSDSIPRSVITPSHHHTITPSHHHTITPSHHHTITPSHHPRHFPCAPHPAASNLRNQSRCLSPAPMPVPPDMSTDPADLLHNPARLAALGATALAGTPPEEAFDRLTRLAVHLLGAPISLLSLIDGEHQWVKSVAGASLGTGAAARHPAGPLHLRPRDRGRPSRSSSPTWTRDAARRRGRGHARVGRARVRRRAAGDGGGTRRGRSLRRRHAAARLVARGPGRRCATWPRWR